MTPPAMGPAGAPGDGAGVDDGVDPIFTQLLTAQVSHPPAVSEQT